LVFSHELTVANQDLKKNKSLNPEAVPGDPFGSLGLLIDTFSSEDLPQIYRILIIHESGLPLFTREFPGEGLTFTPVDFDPLMIGGFISAMASFASTTMASTITDIGIGTLRLFLLRYQDLVFAAIADSSFPNMHMVLTVNEFLHAVAEAFEIINDIRRVSGALSPDSALKLFESKLDRAVLGKPLPAGQQSVLMKSLDPFTYEMESSQSKNVQQGFDKPIEQQTGMFSVIVPSSRVRLDLLVTREATECLSDALSRLGARIAQLGI